MKSKTLSLRENTSLYDNLKSFLEFLKLNDLSLSQKEVQDSLSYNNVLQDYEELDLSGIKYLGIVELSINLAKYSSVKSIVLRSIQFSFYNIEIFKTLAIIPNLRFLDISNTGFSGISNVGVNLRFYKLVMAELFKSKSLELVNAMNNGLDREDVDLELIRQSAARDVSNQAKLNYVLSVLNDHTDLCTSTIMVIGEYLEIPHLEIATAPLEIKIDY